MQAPAFRHFRVMPEKDIIGYTVRCERELKRRLQADAEKHGRSLNRHLVTIWEDYIEGRSVPVDRATKTPAFRALLKEAMKEARKS